MTRAQQTAWAADILDYVSRVVRVHRTQFVADGYSEAVRLARWVVADQRVVPLAAAVRTAFERNPAPHALLTVATATDSRVVAAALRGVTESGARSASVDAYHRVPETESERQRIVNEHVKRFERASDECRRAYLRGERPLPTAVPTREDLLPYLTDPVRDIRVAAVALAAHLEPGPAATGPAATGPAATAPAEPV